MPIRRGQRRLNTQGGIVKRMKLVERKVRGLVPEMQEHCVDTIGTTISSTGTMLDLIQLAGGDDNQTDRLGEEIRLMKLKLKFIITRGATTAAAGFYVRYLLVKSKTGQLNTADFPSRFFACPNYDKYTVLQDNIIDLRASVVTRTNEVPPLAVTWTYGGFTHKQISLSRSYKSGLVIQYDGAGAPTVNNGLYLWLIVPVAGPVLAGYHTFFYRDN